jgi:pyridoxine/pyridoxamine 5'-phosphate oxidase
VDAIDLDADPLRQLAMWLDAARAAGQPMVRYRRGSGGWITERLSP